MSESSPPLLRLGKVGRPHGVKGEICLTWDADYIPSVGDVLLLGSEPGQLRPYGVEGVRQGRRMVIALGGVGDRDAAAALTGASVFMARAALPAPGADACYLADLIGATVTLPNGTVVGQLDHYEFPGGQVVWSIVDEKHREILFPAMPCFIRSLNPDQKCAVIDPPPGLLDVYLA